MGVRSAVTLEKWTQRVRTINPFWENFEEVCWSLACHQFSQALPAVVPADSARSRRCDDWMHRAVDRAFAASDRRNLGLAKPGRLANHCAASTGGRRWHGLPRVPNSRIRGVLRRAWNRCALRWRAGWEVCPALAPATTAALSRYHLGMNCPPRRRFQFRFRAVRCAGPRELWSFRSGL